MPSTHDSTPAAISTGSNHVATGTDIASSFRTGDTVKNSIAAACNYATAISNTFTATAAPTSTPLASTDVAMKAQQTPASGLDSAASVGGAVLHSAAVSTPHAINSRSLSEGKSDTASKGTLAAAGSTASAAAIVPADHATEASSLTVGCGASTSSLKVLDGAPHAAGGEEESAAAAGALAHTVADAGHVPKAQGALARSVKSLAVSVTAEAELVHSSTAEGQSTQPAATQSQPDATQPLSTTATRSVTAERQSTQPPATQSQPVAAAVQPDALQPLFTAITRTITAAVPPASEELDAVIADQAVPIAAYRQQLQPCSQQTVVPSADAKQESKSVPAAGSTTDCSHWLQLQSAQHAKPDVNARIFRQQQGFMFGAQSKDYCSNKWQQHHCPGQPQRSLAQDRAGSEMSESDIRSSYASAIPAVATAQTPDRHDAVSAGASLDTTAPNTRDGTETATVPKTTCGKATPHQAASMTPEPHNVHTLSSKRVLSTVCESNGARLHLHYGVWHPLSLDQAPLGKQISAAGHRKSASWRQSELPRKQQKHSCIKYGPYLENVALTWPGQSSSVAKPTAALQNQ